jgi:hypothetical protein
MDQKKVREEEEQLRAVALSPERADIREKENDYGGGSKSEKLVRIGKAQDTMLKYENKERINEKEVLHFI